MVLFLSSVCVCDLFLCSQVRLGAAMPTDGRLWCCSCRVFVSMTCFSFYRYASGLNLYTLFHTSDPTHVHRYASGRPCPPMPRCELSASRRPPCCHSAKKEVRYVYLCKYVYICMYIYIYIIYVCMYVYLYICTYVCIYIYIYICVCVYIYIYKYPHTHSHTHPHVYIHIHVYVYVHIHIYIYSCIDDGVNP